MRIGKKDPNDLRGKDIWTEVASTTVQIEPTKLILNGEPNNNFGQMAYYDGTTTAKLTVPDSSSWDIFAVQGDSWTIDLWVNPDTISPTHQKLVWHSTDINNVWNLWLNSGVPKLDTAPSGNLLTGTTTCPVGVWSHVAFVKIGTTYGIYINGVQTSYASDTRVLNFTGNLIIGNDISNQEYNGYMDELRIQHSNVFSASPNSGKTDTIIVPTEPHTSDSNTELLLHFDGGVSDSSSKSHTVTNTSVTFEHSTVGTAGSLLFADDSGWGNIVTPNGDATVDTFKFNEAGLFNGTTAYLSAPDSSDWDLVASNSDNWTIDLWVKHNDLTGSQVYVTQVEDANNLWHFYHSPGLAFYVKLSAVNVVVITGGTITDNNWHHIALVKVGTTWGIYLDGVQTAYVVGNTPTTFAGQLRVGVDSSSTAWFDGYMDEVRIIKDNIFSASPNIGKTDTIVVPTSAHTSDANTKLLLHLDNNVTDSGNTVHTITNNNVTFDKAKFGSGMLSFDGTGDYLTVPDNADGRWDLIGSVDTNYTVDMWVRHTDHALSEIYIGHQESAVNDYWKFYHINGTGLCFLATTGGSAVISLIGGGEITDSNWHHVALVKVGSKYAIYKDGTQVNYISDTSTDTYNGLLYIGTNFASSDYFDGEMDALRISKSNVFDANPVVGLTDTITVPTSAPSGGGGALGLPTEIVYDELDSDTAEQYKITTHFVNQAGATVSYFLNINSDSGANYGYQRMSGAVTTVAGSRQGSQTALYITANSLTSGYAGSDGILNAKSGVAKVFSNTWLAQGTGTTVGMVNERSETYSGTGLIDALTISTSVAGGIGEGSVIKIYKLQ